MPLLKDAKYLKRYIIFLPENIGPKRLESKTKPSMGLEVKEFEFNETLSMVSTINKNPRNGSFVEKNVRCSLNTKNAYKSLNFESYLLQLFGYFVFA